ncbi:hypothetical protein BDE02_15G014200 [Populus trichocarpa]|nr:hypothetical protein BDE02_15G014200 [Populus trichocarpa]
MLKRCVGSMMAKMVLRELMDPLIFMKFKSFLMKFLEDWNALAVALFVQYEKISYSIIMHYSSCVGTDPIYKVVPSCLREFLLQILSRNSPSGNVGLQRNRLSCFIELMEMLNAHSRPKNWLELLPGKRRLLYCTGKQIGLTLRQPSALVLIGDVYLAINRASKLNTSISFTSDIGFTVMNGRDWPHDKSGITGKLEVNSLFRLTSGRRLYLKEEKTSEKLSFGQPNNQDSLAQKLSAKKWRKLVPYKEFPSSLPVAKLVSADIEVTMSLGDNLNQNDVTPSSIVQELCVQVPPEMFDLSRLVCGTYVDSRLLVLRGVSGSALLFTRSMC